MSSVESKPSFSPERLQSASAIAIIVDDIDYEYLMWSDVLEKVNPAIYCIGLSSNDDVKQFMRDFSNIDAKKIQYVEVDQFKKGPEDMYQSTQKLLYLIREHNPRCWIVETSCAPDSSPYKKIQTNGIFHWFDMDKIRDKLLETHAMFPTLTYAGLCSLVVNYGYDFASQVYDQKKAPRIYFEYLYKFNELPIFLEKLGLEYEQLDDMFSVHDFDTQRSILHGVYTVLGHMAAGKDEGYYGLPLQRLKLLLGLETDID